MSGSSPRTHDKHPEAAALAQRVRAREVRGISRLITLLESGDPIGYQTLAALAPRGQHALIVGVTGYPGAGKSTLIDQLAAAYRRAGMTVGILAVDPSSPITGGAILGDRIRMQDHAMDPGVFIRSMGTRGHHGGLATSTKDAVRVLEAAGYDVILVETVGVGQDDVEVAGAVQTVVAVVAPGLGDEVQALKSGLLEVAHIVVVNKGDLDGADVTMRDLQEWIPTVIRTVALKGTGVEELVQAIADHQKTLPHHEPRS